MVLVYNTLKWGVYMARKAKKKVHKMPKLSLLDQIIYWVLFAIIWVVALAILFLPIFFGEKIIFADEMVIAGESRSAGWSFVTFVVFILIAVIVWGFFYGDRRPIFGLRKFKYGPPAWPKIYPLVMKNKPSVWVSEKKKKARKRLIVILLVVLLISFIPFSLAFYGRTCLYSNGSVTEYNVLNAHSKEFSAGEIAKVEIEAYKHRTRNTNYTRYLPTWVLHDVRMIITTDSGEIYVFEFKDFRKNDWLTAMLQLKYLFSPEIITYSGMEYLEDIVIHNALTEEETKRLYQLFDQI